MPAIRRVLQVLCLGLFFGTGPLLAQQPDATKFNQNYAEALAKAKQECAALWSDHVFDPLRSKLALSDTKPTLSMLTNSERVRPKDRQLAELAIKTNEKCRQAYSIPFAVLPPQVSGAFDGVYRAQDALIAELYIGKITFGDFNTKMDRLIGDLSRTLSGVPYSPPTPKPQPEAKNVSPPPAATKQVIQQLQKPTAAKITKIALVIGNSSYTNLPHLSNPTNDARSIAELLTKIGFTTHLVLDASDQVIRRETRQFSNKSGSADIALVFYAGHGAQVNGDNYILPTDIDIPRSETDIQLSALKVDDLVNSIRASTKIVFLDACRDNPALFKNMVKGRGAYPKGLAPAIASNLEPTKPGGGVFIAYATDSGSVALDGNGQHSPFTQALLRNLEKPISIDDLFSLVTREVRLATKNTQRPYKYASLENIICLTGECSGRGQDDLAPIEFTQQAKISESEDFDIAVGTNQVAALETYLRKYPNSPRRVEARDKLSSLIRADFNEWTLYEVGGGPNNWRFPHYFKPSTIQRYDSKVAVEERSLVDLSNPAEAQFPEGSYTYALEVFDCSSSQFALAEKSVVTKTGEVLYHYKWADPQFLNLSIGGMLPPGSVGDYLRINVCHDELRTPLIAKADLTPSHFISLSSMKNGDGDIFYLPLTDEMREGNSVTPIVMLKLNDARAVVDELGQGAVLDEPLAYRYQVAKIKFDCTEHKASFLKFEFYDDTKRLVRISEADPSKEIARNDVGETSPYGLLLRIACGLNEAQK
jgi:hypothetical protein